MLENAWRRETRHGGESRPCTCDELNNAQFCWTGQQWHMVRLPLGCQLTWRSAKYPDCKRRYDGLMITKVLL